MNPRRLGFGALLAGWILGLAGAGGCRTASPARVWSDPGFPAVPLERVTVGAVIRPATFRADLERALAEELAGRGTEAAVSVGALGFDALTQDPGAVARRLGAEGRGGLVVVRMIEGDRRTLPNEQPGRADVGQIHEVFTPVPKKEDSFWKTQAMYQNSAAQAGLPSVQAAYHSTDEEQGWEVTVFEPAGGRVVSVAQVATRSREGENPERRLRRIARALGDALQRCGRVR